MKRRRGKPTYDLSKAKDLVRLGKASINGRAIAFIRNHVDVRNPGGVVRKVIESAAEGDFRESYELDMLPGTWVDVYRVRYDDEDWYLKFFIDGEGDLKLNVLSANWWGYQH